MVLDNIFPGSAELFGTTSTMFSRVLGSYALSIAGVRLMYISGVPNFEKHSSCSPAIVFAAFRGSPSFSNPLS